MAEAALSQRMSARRCSSRSCASFGGVAPVMLTAPSAGITFQGPARRGAFAQQASGNRSLYGPLNEDRSLSHQRKRL
jgi:hypothetical protein